MTHPTDNLVRARYDAGTIELRDTSESGRLLHGHFAVFNRWTQIESWFEGEFLERIAPGAFRETFKAKAKSIRVLYDHGADPSIGNKPLGAPDVLREDDAGAYYESELFDAGYVNDLIPALRAGQLGASFRFKVTGESWNEPKKASDANPKALPERTITKVDLYEFGPVTFPAYADASAGVRSGSDGFIESLMADPRFVARFTERCGLSVVEKILASLPDDVRRKATASNGSTDGDATQAPQQQRMTLALARARMALLA